MQPQAQQEEQALSKDEQKSLNDAFAAAHESHAAIYREASSASAAEKDASSNAWMLAAGRHAEPLLFKLGLVDAQYLLALADAGAMSVPRWHEVPPQARIDSEDAWKLRSFDNVSSGLPILFVAEPLCHDQPKFSQGKALMSIMPILRAMVKEAKKHAPHGTVAVFWPHMCIPPGDAEGTAGNEQRMQVLSGMAELITHPFTIIAMMPDHPRSFPVKLPSVGAPGGRPKRRLSDTAMEAVASVVQRHASEDGKPSCGWCYVAHALGGLSKQGWCLWDLSRYKKTPKPQGFAKLSKEIRARTRTPPWSPERFGRELEACVQSGTLSFDHKGDAGGNSALPQAIQGDV